MSTTQQTHRIDFIDLAKGICIFLVVAGHCGAPINIPGYDIVRMPLYFILSGLFFKTYGGVIPFIIKKLNKILIPFIFFYVLGNIAFYAIKYTAPQLLITDARGIFDLFDNRQFFNGPIWFLLCLFWCNIYFCIISTYVKKDSVRIAIIALLGFIGWYLGYKEIFIPLFLDVAMTALPFFTFGYYLKKSNILYPNGFDRYNLIFACALWTISFTLTMWTSYRLSLHYNGINGISTYIISITSVLSILFICKKIKRLPFFSYIGRYSIILLCVHHMIYRPVKVLLQSTNIEIINNEYVVALITLLLSTLCIPVCIKYIPWFVAQKNLIEERKIKL